MSTTVWSATVDSPSSGISTSVHASEREAEEHVLEVYDGSSIQELCNAGYVINFDSHVLRNDSPVVVCRDCGHVHPEPVRITEPHRCSRCPCKSDRRDIVQDQQMVRIEGHDLESLLVQLKAAQEYGGISHIRVSYRGPDQVAFKINEGEWSPGLGRMQPPY